MSHATWVPSLATECCSTEPAARSDRLNERGGVNTGDSARTFPDVYSHRLWRPNVGGRVRAGCTVPIMVRSQVQLLLAPRKTR